MATSGKWSCVAQDLLSLLNGCTSGNFVLSQFVEALSLISIIYLNIEGEVDMVFSVVLNLLTFPSNLN